MTEPSRSPRVLAAVVIAVIVLLAHARIWVGGQTWDDIRYHTEITPPRLAASEAILAGEPPTWWEGTGFGVPLLGEPSHGAAYPLTWLAATPRLADFLVLFHLLWLALGIGAWSRRRGASSVATVVAGALAAASGLAVAAGLRGALPALAQLPWIAWAAHGIANAESPRDARRAAAALGLVLGLAGLSGQLGLFLDGIVLALVVGARRRTLRWLALGIVGGIAIASAQAIPAIAVAGQVTGGPAVTPLAPLRLLDLVVPVTTTSAMWPSLFLGGAALALGVLARPSRQVIGAALVFLIVAFVIGRGGSWPAVAGAPEGQVAAIAVLLCTAAASGFDRLTTSGMSRDVLVAIAASAAATIAAMVLRAGDDAVVLADGGLTVACLVAVLVVVWRVRSERRVLALAVLAVAPSIGSLGASAPLTSARDVETMSPWVLAARSTIQATNPKLPLRLFRPVHMDDHRTLTAFTAVRTLAGTSAAPYGVGAARSEDPARPPLHDSLWLSASAMGGSMLARYGITLAILPASVVGQHGLTALDVSGDSALVTYPAVPAAAMAFEWLWAADGMAALPRLFPPGGRGLPPGLVVLEGSGTEQQDEPRPPEPCTVTRWARGAIDLTCAAEAPSYAVVTSTSLPGWDVEVDGRDTPWETADVVRRAVKLDAGAHVVSWRYIAPGAALGFALALTALIGLAGMAVLSRPRRVL